MALKKPLKLVELWSALDRGLYTRPNSSSCSVQFLVTREQALRAAEMKITRVFFRNGGNTAPSSAQIAFLLSKNHEAVYLGSGEVRIHGVLEPDERCEVFGVRKLEGKSSPLDEFTPDSTPFSDEEMIIREAVRPHLFLTAQEALDMMPVAAGLLLAKRDPYRVISCAISKSAPFPSKLENKLRTLFGMRVELFAHCNAPMPRAFYAVEPIALDEIERHPIDLTPYLPAMHNDYALLWRVFWKAISNYPRPTLRINEFGDVELSDALQGSSFEEVQGELVRRAKNMTVRFNARESS